VGTADDDGKPAVSKVLLVVVATLGVVVVVVVVVVVLVVVVVAVVVVVEIVVVGDVFKVVVVAVVAVFDVGGGKRVVVVGIVVVVDGVVVVVVIVVVLAGLKITADVHLVEVTTRGCDVSRGTCGRDVMTYALVGHPKPGRAVPIYSVRMTTNYIESYIYRNYNLSKKCYTIKVSSVTFTVIALSHRTD